MEMHAYWFVVCPADTFPSLRINWRVLEICVFILLGCLIRDQTRTVCHDHILELDYQQRLRVRSQWYWWEQFYMWEDGGSRAARVLTHLRVADWWLNCKVSEWVSMCLYMWICWWMCVMIYAIWCCWWRGSFVVRVLLYFIYLMKCLFYDLRFCANILSCLQWR